jgi:hypothetical protein
MNALVKAMDILDGSKVATEPLRRIVLYWSKDKFDEEATELDSLRENISAEFDVETFSTACGM